MNNSIILEGSKSNLNNIMNESSIAKGLPVVQKINIPSISNSKPLYPLIATVKFARKSNNIPQKNLTEDENYKEIIISKDKFYQNKIGGETNFFVLNKKE